MENRTVVVTTIMVRGRHVLATTHAHVHAVGFSAGPGHFIIRSCCRTHNLQGYAGSGATQPPGYPEPPVSLTEFALSPLAFLVILNFDAYD